MKIQNLRTRIGQLEKRQSDKAFSINVVVRCVTQQFALDLDQCVRIVYESRAHRRGISVLNMFDVPSGLSADQLESYLRQHAEEICAPGVGPR